MKRHTVILSAGAAILLGCGMVNTPFASAAEQTPKGWGTQFLENMKKWEDKMSDVFRDSLNAAKGEKSAYTASVDLREQADHYTVRVHVPDRDASKIKITLEGQTLKIGGDDGYDQSIVLRHAKPDAKVDVQHRGQTLVVTVPKTDQPIAKPAPKPSFAEPDRWEQDVLTRMENMRREMDRVFEDAFKGFGPGIGKGYFDLPQFGSSIDLKEEKDRYVVRAYLPGRDVQNVDVKVKDQLLTIEAKAEQREKKAGDTSALESLMMSNYSQALTLPGPVKVEQMQVERKEGLLVITLPKKEGV